MAWPFSNSSAPNFDTSLTSVPTGLTVVDASNPIWLIGALFSNPTAGPITIEVSNSSGVDLVPSTEIPPGMAVPFSFTFVPCNGLKWLASAAGLKGQLWGYK